MSWLPMPSASGAGCSRAGCASAHTGTHLARVEKADPLLARFDSRERLKLRSWRPDCMANALFRRAGAGFNGCDESVPGNRIAIVIYGWRIRAKYSLDWLRNWREIIVYPSAFKPHRQSVSRLGGSPWVCHAQ